MAGGTGGCHIFCGQLWALGAVDSALRNQAFVERWGSGFIAGGIARFVIEFNGWRGARCEFAGSATGDCRLGAGLFATAGDWRTDPVIARLALAGSGDSGTCLLGGLALLAGLPVVGGVFAGLAIGLFAFGLAQAMRVSR